MGRIPLVEKMKLIQTNGNIFFIFNLILIRVYFFIKINN